LGVDSCKTAIEFVRGQGVFSYPKFLLLAIPETDRDINPDLEQYPGY
jgi:hypothetical protein